MRAEPRKYIEEVYEEIRHFGFPRKGEGRIYVQKEEDIEKVEKIIREIDEYEFDYLPEDFITTADQYPKTVFVGKFDAIPVEQLTAKCWKAGVPVWCICEGKGTL